MRRRWSLLLIPPVLFTASLLVFSQFAFLKSSFYEDLGLGRTGDRLTLQNFVLVFTDPYYLDSLWLTMRLSGSVVAATVLVAWPVAYILSRAPVRIAAFIVVLIVAAYFVTLPIKVLGLIILFNADGPAMTALRAVGLIDDEARFLGSLGAVGVGYVHLSITFMITLLYGVLRGVPTRLDEAASALGASRLRVVWTVILPLSLPGTVSAVLLSFNLLAGAFVSAALLGGGKVLTLPVLVQRSLIQFNDYGISAALAAVLLAIVLVINIVSVFAASRFTPAARIVT